MADSLITKRIVVIGASSGGLEALRVIAEGLPSGFPAAVCAVMHVSPDAPDLLAMMLNRRAALPASTAMSGDRLQAGRIYVAPPDHHLVVEPGVLRVTKGPKENRFRPAIDPLFRSAAQVYGPAAVGVILTGSLDDGTAGLWAVKQLGGIAIVQDPADALFSSMPRSAIRHVRVDHVVPLSRMASLLARVAAAPVDGRGSTAVPGYLDVEVNIAKEVNAVDAGMEGIGEPSAFACPECHGVLLKLKNVEPARFRCHTGHAYSPLSLVAAVSGAIDDALWNAIRALEEGGLLMQHLATHARHNQDDATALAFEAQALETRRQSDAVRQVALARQGLTTTDS